MGTKFTPQAYSEPCFDIRGTPIGEEATPKSNFARSSVYPQRFISNPHNTRSSSHHPQVQTLTPKNPNQPNPISSSYTLSRSPSLSDMGLNQSDTPDPKNPRFIDSNLSPVVSPSLVGGPHSPTKSGPSPSRKLQEVFREARDRGDIATRISSLVNNIEEEMLHSGVKVNFSKFKEHLVHLQEAGPDESEKIGIAGEYVKVEDPLEIKLFPPTQGTRMKNWNTLFKAQAPSKSMNRNSMTG